MRNLFVACTIALIFGAYSERVGICQFNGDFIGDVTFTETVNEEQQIVVQVAGTITGPKTITGEHGFHIHQYGDLRDNIGSAGSHFNPYNEEHGCVAPSHLGDLGNIEFTLGTDKSTAIIDSDPTSIIDAELYSDITLIGRTLVIHEKKDDCTKTPNIGARIAQCVIGYKEGNVGYYTPSIEKTTPQAICVLEDMELQIIFEQDESIGSVKATINKADYENNIFLSLNESVDTIKFNPDYSKLLFDTTPNPLLTNIIVDGLSIRYSTEGIVNIIGKAVYCADDKKVQHSCVIGFYNSAYPPTTTTTTTTSTITTADPTKESTTTTTVSTTGDATTGDATTTTTTTGDSTGNATSTTGSTTMTNTTTDASTSTSGQVVNPALNTTDTSGGAVLGIIFATFILLGLAWYTYVNRGNNQRRIGYFGV